MAERPLFADGKAFVSSGDRFETGDRDHLFDHDKHGTRGAAVKELRGKYNTAIVYADEVEPSAAGQITALCDQRFSEGSRIRIMPDVHACKGCTVGTTMTLTDKTVPNLVGVDIGCGMLCIKLRDKRIDFSKLDKLIRGNVPSGMKIREKRHRFADGIDLGDFVCARHVQQDRAYLSIGSLGGGNHFIEVDRDGDGCLYLVIHSGSRHLGVEVAGHYQKIAGEKRPADVPFELAYVEGQAYADYLHDMTICTEFAALNRRAIADEIIKGMKLKKDDEFTTVHNYIDIESGILRKGSVSARKGERLLIPLNMRDGSLVCTGRGNPEWNYSAPHGAGRILSRSKAKESITLSAFKLSMEGIYSTSVSKETIDESPQAYKPAETILAAIGGTVEVNAAIRPVYNYKAV